jgi:hypothetical protein
MGIITSWEFRVKIQAAWAFGSPATAACIGAKRWLGWLLNRWLSGAEIP